MTLEVWELVAVVSGAAGGFALLARQGLNALHARQVRGLVRDSQALQQWWDALGGLPAEVLTPSLRRTLARILDRHLVRARRLDPEHPWLLEQRARIDRFVDQPPARAAAGGEEQVIGAVQNVRELLARSACGREVSYHQRVGADAMLAGHLTRLEFLRDQRRSLQSDYLRRVTQALGAAPEGRQLPGGSRALPTQ